MHFLAKHQMWNLFLWYMNVVCVIFITELLSQYTLFYSNSADGVDSPTDICSAGWFCTGRLYEEKPTSRVNSTDLTDCMSSRQLDRREVPAWYIRSRRLSLSYRLYWGTILLCKLRKWKTHTSVMYRMHSLWNLQAMLISQIQHS